jgi:phosphotriesterase-related protein
VDGGLVVTHQIPRRDVQIKEIMTVLGPIAPEELGFTDMHAHILTDMSVWRRLAEPLMPDNLPVSGDEPVSLENVGLLRRNWFLLADNMLLDDEEVMAAEVADFKASGGAAMVDMSCPGLRFNLPGIQRISQKTGVHVVATTGLYVEDSWPEYAWEMTVEQLTKLMVKEIEEGIEDTGIKAGHIGELGMSTLSERDVRLLRAAARASIQTGLSVSVHQKYGRADGYGQRIVDVLTQEGMEPERIIIGHVDGYLVERELRVLIKNPDRGVLNLDYAKGLLDRGVNIAFDCFGHIYEWDGVVGPLLIGPEDWQRIAALLALTDAGYASQIVWGTDSCCKLLVRRYGGEGYCRLTNYVVPTLEAVGVSDCDIRQMTVDNPARLLAR